MPRRQRVASDQDCKGESMRNGGLWPKGLGLRDAGDWRTLLLVISVQALILALLFVPFPLQQGGAFLIILCLAPLITLYSSTQHEVIHGHPFRNQFFNDLMCLLPLTVLVPYFRFKDTHLAHHKDVNLCDPYDDPETWYQDPEVWAKRGRISQAVFNFNNTLFGRMLIGPVIGMSGFVRNDFRLLFAGEAHIGWKWLLHTASVTLLFGAVHSHGSIPAWFLLLAAYLGMSLLMVRTYLEHQAHEKVRGRSVIIENGGLFAFLFLNNSLHAVHHAYPSLAWYRLPRLFAENRQRFLKLNDGYSFETYRSVFKKYIFRRKEPVPYPEDLKTRR